MYTQLFPDDQRLLGRAGTRRVYGRPELMAEYEDPLFSTDYFSPWVFEKDGGYMMLYVGKRRDTGEMALLAAKSADGVHFQPLKTREKENGEEKAAPHQLMPLKDGIEPISVLEDRFAPAGERYKLILTVLDSERFCIHAEVYASPDLLSWRLFLPEIPDWHCEPVGGAFYNPKRDCYTILHRRTWGDRGVGYQDTRDFIHYTPYETCMHQDALDEALDEIYGMSAFEYAGLFVGFPLVYTDNAPSRRTKFDPGNIYPQLAFSPDGHHFQRSLRRSFLPEYQGQPSLNWLSCALNAPDGGLYLYCAHSPEPHGVAFRTHQNGRIRIYRLRRDGFIGLETESEATVITREFLFRGGDISVNLQAENATMAVIDTSGDDPASHVWGMDAAAPGFDHDFCEPFSGDSVCWRPRFGGRDLEELKGRVIILEIRYTRGVLYSVSGEIEPLSNTEAARWRKTGLLSIR